MTQAETKPVIGIVLPFGENFSPTSASAISLCVRDAALVSRHADRITVFGRPQLDPFTEPRYVGLKPVMPRLMGLNVGLGEQMWRRLRGGPPALIEVHNRPGVMRFLARRVTGAAVTLHLHNDPTTMRFSRSAWARRDILRQAAAVYCVSEFIRDRFLDGIGDPSGKVRVLYNGIHRPFSQPPAKENRLLFVGRLIEDKGAHHVVAALEKLLPAFPDWQAILIGADRAGQTGPGKPFEQDIQARCSALGPQVQFRGFMPHDAVMEEFGRASIALVPSLWPDPFPRTAVEALASGCAVVAYPAGGLTEAVTGRGALVEPATPHALTAALLDLMLNPSSLHRWQERAWNDYPFAIETLTEQQDRWRDELMAALVERRRH